MLEHVTTLFCRGHQEFQPFADLPLPGELAEHWRSQRDFEGSIGFRRFHGRVCGNLITLNRKLRTTRFVDRKIVNRYIVTSLNRRTDSRITIHGSPFTKSSSSTPVRSRGAAKYNPPDRRRSESSSDRGHRA